MSQEPITVTMDDIIAEIRALRSTIDTQAATITRQGQTIATQQQAITAFNAAANPTVNVAAPVVNVAAATGGGFKVNKPEPFKGERGAAAKTFIQTVELYFSLRPTDFPDDRHKIKWTLLLLQDKAGRWAQPINHEILNPVPGANPSARTTVWNDFREAFKLAFFDPDEKRSASNKINTLHQTRSVAEYAAEFRELVSILGWTEDGQLQTVFYRGLKDHVKDDLVNREEPDDLDELVEVCVKIDNRHWQRAQEKKQDHPTPKPKPTNPFTPKPTNPFAPKPVVNVPFVPAINTTRDPNAMDLSAARGKLTPQERQRRMTNNLCLYCGQAGHRKDAHFTATVAAVEQDGGQGQGGAQVQGQVQQQVQVQDNNPFHQPGF